MLPRVTVAEAFRSTLEALLRARGMTQTQLAEMAGLDISTISRLIGGSRTDRFDSIEKIRAAFGLRPADLFDEDAALAQIGLRRNTDANPGAGQKLDSGPHTVLQSASPNSAEGGSALLRQPDSELLAALLVYWNEMSPEARLELVGHGHRLRKAAAAAALTVGFKRG